MKIENTTLLASTQNVIENLLHLNTEVSVNNERLQVSMQALKEFESSSHIKANELFLSNATEVLRTILKVDGVKQHFERLLFAQQVQHGILDGRKYIPLVSKPEQRQDPSLLKDIFDGDQRPSISHHLALIISAKARVFLWSEASISYCESSSTATLNDSEWLEISPVFDDPEFITPLLHLQTPETALLFLMQKFTPLH